MSTVLGVSIRSHTFCIGNDVRQKRAARCPMYGVLVGRGMARSELLDIKVFVPLEYATSPWTNAAAVSLALMRRSYHRVTLRLKTFGLNKIVTLPRDTLPLPPGHVSDVWSREATASYYRETASTLDEIDLYYGAEGSAGGDDYSYGE